MKLTLFSTLAVTMMGNVHALEVGDTFCVEGFVMDRFCIEQGFLLDAPEVVTLMNPELHSFHCLLDVGVCVGSAFELLSDPTGDEDFGRGFELSEATKTAAVALGKEIGSCEECVNGNDDTKLAMGFRAVLVGSVESIASDVPDGQPTMILAHDQIAAANGVDLSLIHI